MKSLRCYMAAACLAGMTSRLPAAESLPRIFYSPTERVAIIAQRRRSPSEPAPSPVASPAPDSTSASTTPSAPPPTVALRLDGISIAQGGDTFAWFNGQRYSNGSLMGSARLHIAQDGVRLISPGGKVRTIRVGQTLESKP